MGNASKALLMAGGVLIGILILALIVTLFISSSSMFTSYEETKKSEAIQQFNVNFTKYLGQDLTIHQVVTICNFAKENGVNAPTDKEIDINNDYTESKVQTYKISIEEYENGYVRSISFTKSN